MVEELRQELTRLNQLLEGVTPYRLGVATPEDMRPADVNAHFMSKRVYDQLVANIKRDGNLATLPFCWHDAGGGIHILSGHHRIDAARDAGVTALLYLYTDGVLSADERTAIQISHNALVGEDDLAILKRQWESIASLEARLYSGLDDERFKSFDPITLGAFNEKDIRFETIELLFLPAEIERITEIVKKLGKSKRVRFVGHVDQYDALADALMRLKDASAIFNSATAFLLMAEAADRYADFLERMETLDDAGWLALHAQLVTTGLVDPLKPPEKDETHSDETPAGASGVSR
jgi:hypothetical protein